MQLFAGQTCLSVLFPSFKVIGKSTNKQIKKKIGDLKLTCFCYSNKDERENNLPTNLLKTYSTSPATCIMETALKMGFQISHLWCVMSTRGFNIMGKIVN